jgi:hypothetical protein
MSDVGLPLLGSISRQEFFELVVVPVVYPGKVVKCGLGDLAGQLSNTEPHLIRLLDHHTHC